MNRRGGLGHENHLFAGFRINPLTVFVPDTCIYSSMSPVERVAGVGLSTSDFRKFGVCALIDRILGILEMRDGRRRINGPVPLTFLGVVFSSFWALFFWCPETKGKL